MIQQGSQKPTYISWTSNQIKTNYSTQ
jgi:hypothetical protein